MALPTPTNLQLNIVVVGEPGCGKTSLILAYIDESFSLEIVPCFYDGPAVSMTYRSCEFCVSFADCSGMDKQTDALRETLYNSADFIIVCYGIDDPVSLHKAETVWIPEIYRVAPGASIILVSTKKDLRDNPNNHVPPISPNELLTDEDGYNVFRRTHSKLIVETSALTKEGVLKLFNGIYELSLQNKKKKKQHCVIF
ncbi:hypothetical protein, conserved [Entamoeba dispar SAW760]|uniref:small monomeric GTPase n=1 Tax=Entamoeba dispar (strain ATCC PRA-260 / SAW760) TaxID=370354 RepID=B0ER21_ENTDS|nr:uncharacterized protein EDI_123950 [Entamoeba dispar SAW760]EDR23030.1 hypothetical protein, conserved [Entamoeba dispar SAW760]|eukprot:EDR23030.1 hypothetical protein, conserved [Entamoeba dispar SAW760]